jgi:hypothetical protein
MYDGGFIEGKKNQDENLDFPSKPGAGGRTPAVHILELFFFFFFFFFCIGGREHVFRGRSCAEISRLWLFRACFLPCIPFLSRFLGKDFLLCVQVLGLQFLKRFSGLHFRVSAFFLSACFLQQGFSARFLRRGSSTFPSVRFQLVSF